jgi:hypothetical protein
MGAFSEFKPIGDILNGEKLMRYDYQGNDHLIALVKVNDTIHLATKKIVVNGGAVIGQVDTEFKIRPYTDALAILNTPTPTAKDKNIVNAIIAILDKAGKFPNITYNEIKIYNENQPINLTEKIGYSLIATFEVVKNSIPPPPADTSTAPGAIIISGDYTYKKNKLGCTIMGENLKIIVAGGITINNETVKTF